MASGFCLVGCGRAFDAIAGEPAAYAVDGTWEIRRAAGVPQLAATARMLLEGLLPGLTRLFIAVDMSALNYARLELHDLARQAGLDMPPLVHAKAWVAPDVQLGGNVWIGPGAMVSSGCTLEDDILVNAGVRADAGVRIGPHGWIGPGTSIGAGAVIGHHCVIGPDVQLRAGLQVGHHSTIDRAGAWSTNLPNGSFAEAELETPARLVGAGYSFRSS